MNNWRVQLITFGVLERFFLFSFGFLSKPYSTRECLNIRFGLLSVGSEPFLSRLRSTRTPRPTSLLTYRDVSTHVLHWIEGTKGVTPRGEFLGCPIGPDRSPHTWTEVFRGRIKLRVVIWTLRIIDNSFTGIKKKKKTWRLTQNPGRPEYMGEGRGVLEGFPFTSSRST